jgi:hypothetical protein
MLVIDRSLIGQNTRLCSNIYREGSSCLDHDPADRHEGGQRRGEDQRAPAVSEQPTIEWQQAGVHRGRMAKGDGGTSSWEGDLLALESMPLLADISSVSSYVETEVLAGQLADLLDEARAIPFMPNRVRVDRVKLCRLVDQIDEGFGNHVLDRTRESRGENVLQAANDLRKAIKHARTIPFTDQIRLPRELTAQLAKSLRVHSRP